MPCPGPSRATGELSLCLENILLFGHSAKSLFSLSFSRLFFCSPLPPLSVRGGYWNLTAHEPLYGTTAASRAPGPCLDGAVGMGGPCRPQSMLRFPAPPQSPQPQRARLAPGLAASSSAVRTASNCASLRRVVGKLNYQRSTACMWDSDAR